MKKKRKRVLVVGLFIDRDKHIPTPAMALAQLLKKNGYDVLHVSKYKARYKRLFDSVSYIIRKSRRYDVGVVSVYSGLSVILEYIMTILLKMLGKKVIMVIHGGALPERMGRHKWRYLPLLKMGDVLLAPSPFMIRSLKKYGLDIQLVENVLEIHNYQFHKKDNIRPSIFWMRALSPTYNPEMAVKVVHELKTVHNYQDVKLYMAGPEWGSKESVIQTIQEYDLGSNVELIGFVNMEGKKQYTDICDIYMCTNRIDNAPVSFIEMMAFGIPIVSTNVGGIPDLVTDNETALLVNSEDHVAMAKRINDLIKDDSIAQRLINNGRQKVNDYTEEAVFKKWDRIFEQL